MEHTPGRDLAAQVEELAAPDPTDLASLEASAQSFDETARLLSETLAKAQG